MKTSKRYYNSGAKAMNPRASQLWQLYAAAVRASAQAQEAEQRKALRVCFARLVELDKAEPFHATHTMNLLPDRAAIQTSETPTK